MPIQFGSNSVEFVRNELLELFLRAALRCVSGVLQQRRFQNAENLTAVAREVHRHLHRVNKSLNFVT